MKRTPVTVKASPTLKNRPFWEGDWTKQGEVCECTLKPMIFVQSKQSLRSLPKTDEKSYLMM